MCFSTLSYLPIHIWTDLLTQCTQCQFLSADVCELQVYTHIYSAQKIPRKLYKTSAFQKTPEDQGEPEGDHPLPSSQWARPHPWSRQQAAWRGGGSLLA